MKRTDGDRHTIIADESDHAGWLLRGGHFDELSGLIDVFEVVFLKWDERGKGSCSCIAMEKGCG